MSASLDSHTLSLLCQCGQTLESYFLLLQILSHISVKWHRHVAPQGPSDQVIYPSMTF